MIALAAAALAALSRAVEAAYPQEGCGLLVGAWDGEGNCTIERIAESANLAGEPQHRFEVDPRLQLALQRELRGRPERVVGVYHSHPDGAPEPSETDRGRAFDRDLVWLIASVESGKLAGLKCFRPAGPGEDFVEIGMRTGS